MKVLIAAIALIATVGGAMAENADSQVIKKMKNCGSDVRNEFGRHIEYPAVKEGGGFVGFLTVDEDATGTRQRYSLVNCETRKITQIKAEYKLADAGRTLKAGKDLATWVKNQRAAGQLANESAFARLAKHAGYPVGTATLAPRGDAKTVRADCGCKAFYPDLYWK
jgi:hypothetical protein